MTPETIQVTDVEFDKLEAAFSQDVKHNPKLKKAARKNDEAHLQAAILIAWGSHPRLRIARVNTGAAMLNGRLVKFGVPGTGDLVGLIAPTGRMLQIEVKTAKGKQREAQTRMQRIVTQFGGLYVVARSVQDVDAALAAEGITR